MAGDEIQTGNILVSGTVDVLNDAKEVIAYRYVMSDELRILCLYGDVEFDKEPLNVALPYVQRAIVGEKIEFYDSIDMHELAIVSPIDLMQSTSLSYARYQFYLSKGILIKMSNYKKLFISNKRIESQHGIKKETLFTRIEFEEQSFHFR